MSQRDKSVNQYTLGRESTFAEGLWSVGVRMPLVTRYDFFDTGAPAPTETASVSGAAATLAAQFASVLNTTSGVHVHFSRDTILRTAAAFPMPKGNGRAFDAEVLVQLERRF